MSRVWETCDECNGTGRSWDDGACAKCDGDGVYCDEEEDDDE